LVTRPEEYKKKMEKQILSSPFFSFREADIIKKNWWAMKTKQKKIEGSP
jgi:hypothetical protein